MQTEFTEDQEQFRETSLSVGIRRRALSLCVLRVVWHLQSSSNES